MQIRTFSRLVGALAYLFGKVQASEDTGVVVVSAFWLGKYWVLTETHLTKRAADDATATHYGQTSTDDYIYSDEVSGAKPRHR